MRRSGAVVHCGLSGQREQAPVQYRSGRSKTWLKIKNPQAPGVTRFEDRDAPA
jgi:hypothetical protein